MTIPPVTSLADLEFKAKTDRHYQQLAILGYNSIEHANVKLYSTAIERLHKMAVSYGYGVCVPIIKYVNLQCNKIKPEKDPAIELLKKKEFMQVIENLKKLRTVTKKDSKKIRRRIARTV